MGLDFHGFTALVMTSSKKPLGKTVTLGRQGIHGIQQSVVEVLGKGAASNVSETYCERLLVEHLGASEVDSIDITDYEGATFTHDMNTQIPEDLAGIYDTVVDLGTLEHIFDIRQALENVSQLCKPEGQILHVLPSDNFSGHGFWQFSPELFFSLYSLENGYRNTEVFLADLSDSTVWYKVLPLENGQRGRLHTDSPTYVIARTVKFNQALHRPTVNQADYEMAWGNRLSPNVNQPLSRGPEISPNGIIRKLVNSLRKYWLVEVALIAPYRAFLNRRTRLGAKNTQLVVVPLGTLTKLK